MMYTIFCLLITHTYELIEGIFFIKICADEPVAIFLDKVKEANRPFIPDDILPRFLIAWKPKSFFPGHPPRDVAEHVGKLNLNSEDNCAATQLNPTLNLRAYFPNSPPLGVVHIIVQLPSQLYLISTRLGLPRVEVEPDSFDRLVENLAASSFVLGAPSTVSKPSEFQTYQSTSNRILNDRPSKDAKVPPIALLYPPFGDFIDHIRERTEKELGVDLRKFQFAVDEFASVMCNHFENEPERRDAVLPVLNDIFECYEPFSLPLITPSKIAGERMSDGHANGPAEVMETVVEIKSEFGSGQTDPEIQSTSYFLQMYYAHIRDGPYKESFQKYLCPTLAVTIIGSYVGFGAFVLLEKARYVPLTPLLSARSPSGDDTDRPALFRAFRAACILRTRIHDDTQHVINNTPTLPRIRDRYLPCVQKTEAWPPTDDSEGQLEFRIHGVAYQGDDLTHLRFWYENRFIYHARTEHEEVLVKFTRRYCPELHHFCAQRGHAPKLLGYGTVPGGWKVVVMEAIKHNHIRALHAPTYWATWEQDLTGLVQDFHARGLVHGDLRDDNFIVPSDGPEIIMLIDFDWGGEAGKVRFPTWLLNEELMDGKRMESLEITREHDIRVLTAALEGLRPVENDPPSKAPSKLKRKAPTSPPSSQPTPCKVAHGLTVAGPSYMGSSSSG